MAPRHILLVEDDPSVRRALIRLLNHPRYTVADAASVQEALALIDSASHELLITDLGLPDGDGVQVVRAFRKRFPKRSIIIISAQVLSDEKKGALRECGISAFLAKPFDIRALESAVRKALPKPPAK